MRNYLVVAAIATPPLALVAKMAAKRANTEVRYLAAVGSTAAAYCINIFLGVLLGLTLKALSAPPSMWIRLFVSFFGVATAHAVFLKSVSGEKVGLQKAGYIAVSQMIAGALVVGGIYGIYLTVNKAN